MQKVHRYETRVRYKETDRMGVIHHSNYVVYFEMGRTEFMRDAGISYAGLESRGVFLAVTSLTLNYRNRGLYEDLIVVETWIESIGSVRITFGYNVRRKNDGVLLADGTTQLACVGSDFKPQRIPREVAEVAMSLCLGKDETPRSESRPQRRSPQTSEGSPS